MYYACAEPGVVSIAVKDVPCRGFGVISVPRVTWPCRATADSTELSPVTPSRPARPGKKSPSDVLGSSPAIFNVILEGERGNQLFRGAAEDACFSQKQPCRLLEEGRRLWVSHNLLSGDLVSRKRGGLISSFTF